MVVLYAVLYSTRKHNHSQRVHAHDLPYVIEVCMHMCIFESSQPEGLYVVDLCRS